MWPMGHAAVAYLLYVGYRRLGTGRAPAGAAVLLVAIGSQFPDLVDKPLSWYLGMLPTGRSLAHSLIVLGPLTGLAYAVAQQFDRTDVAAAFGIGAVSHTLVDAGPALWSGSDASFLLWPIAVVEPYEEGAPSVLAMLLESLTDPYFHLEFVLLAVAFMVWRHDGYPGLSLFRPQIAEESEEVRPEAPRP